MTLSARIAGFVTGVEPGKLPPEAVAHARRAFIDTTGVMLAGSRTHHAGIVHDMIREEGAAPTVGVVGSALRTSPQLAALANGVAGHGMDYDFSYLMGQPLAGLIPALYPLAEKLDAPADELIAAFIIGFEVASRIARANPEHSIVGGWHATGSIGTIATAAACARLLKIPEKAIPDVIGIAVAASGSVPVNFGTMTKPFHAGNAARNAITAALLGKSGYTSSAVSIEGKMGYFNAFARGQTVHPEVFDDLGVGYDLAKYGFTVKAYPCGGLAHPAIDAAVELRQELGPRVADIASVKVGITRFAARNIKTDYPATEEAAKFSAPFITAYTLLRGAPMIDAFSEMAIHDPEVRALGAKVTGFTDTSFGDPVEIPLPARVMVMLKNGTVVEKVKTYAIGSPVLPMSAAQLKVKFMDCATRALKPDAADRLHAELSTLGEQPSLKALWPMLRG